MSSIPPYQVLYLIGISLDAVSLPRDSDAYQQLPLLEGVKTNGGRPVYIRVKDYLATTQTIVQPPPVQGPVQTSTLASTQAPAQARAPPTSLHPPSGQTTAQVPGQVVRQPRRPIFDHPPSDDIHPRAIRPLPAHRLKPAETPLPSRPSKRRRGQDGDPVEYVAIEHVGERSHRDITPTGADYAMSGTHSSFDSGDDTPRAQRRWEELQPHREEIRYRREVSQPNPGLPRQGNQEIHSRRALPEPRRAIVPSRVNPPAVHARYQRAARYNDVHFGYEGSDNMGDYYGAGQPRAGPSSRPY